MYPPNSILLFSLLKIEEEKPNMLQNSTSLQNNANFQKGKELYIGPKLFLNE